MLDVCFVHLKPVRSEKADFATIVPCRMADLLGSEVRLHVIYMGTINEDKLQRKGIRTYRYDGVLAGNRWTRYIGLAIFIAEVLWRQDVDVVQNVWMHFGLFPLKVAGLIAGVPVVARVVGVPIGVAETNDMLKWTRNRLGRALERASLALADHIQVISKHLGNVFARRGASSEQISVISTGCDTDKFRPTEKETASRDFVRILYVGRINPLKGIVDLLQGYALYRNELQAPDRSTELVIAGGGERSNIDQMKTLATTHEISDATDFLGHVEHHRLPQFYNDADIFALPSHGEGLGNAFLEAMACGLPCLGTNVGAIPELLADNRGVIVSPKSPTEIAEGLYHLIEDASYRLALGRRARAYVVKEHSFESVRQKYVELYRTVLSLHGTGKRNQAR